jgi:hypothetical protein
MEYVDGETLKDMLRQGPLAALALLSFAGVRFLRHQAKVRWARNIAVPEIERMIEANDCWRNLVPAYRLAGNEERTDDPRRSLG